MAIKFFTLGLMIFAIGFFYQDISHTQALEKKTEQALLSFEDATMIQMDEKEVTQIITAHEAYKFQNKEILYNATVVTRIEDEDNFNATDTLSADTIVKQKQHLEMSGNVMMQRDSLMSISTQYLRYNLMDKVAQNSHDFVAHYKDSILRGDTLFVDGTQKYFEAHNTQFEINMAQINKDNK